MSKSKAGSSFRELQEDFQQALDRLRQGKPKNAELRERYGNGRLKINKLTVAKEAGHSRTTYVNHPDIDEFVEKQLNVEATTKLPTASDVNRSLRKDIASLERDKVLLTTQLADLVRYTRNLERDFEKLNKKLERLQRTTINSSIQTVDRVV